MVEQHDHEDSGSHKINFILARGDFEAVKIAAGLAGVTVSAYLRQCAIKGFLAKAEEIRRRFGYGELIPTKVVDLSQIIPSLEVREARPRKSKG